MVCTSSVKIVQGHEFDSLLQSASLGGVHDLRVSAAQLEYVCVLTHSPNISVGLWVDPYAK